jgi:WD40 repeat protein
MENLGNRLKDVEFFPSHAFGIHGPLRDNILTYRSRSLGQQQSSESIVFPIGAKLASFYPYDKSIEFFGTDRIALQDITAMTISPNEKVIAVSNFGGTCGEGGAHVYIFALSNKKHISTLLHRSKVVSLCFSVDSKQLIGASDGSIVIWSWEKEKVTLSASINGRITRVSCPPQSHHLSASSLLFSSTGPGYARIWMASPRQRLNNTMIMSSQAKEQKFNFQDHTWVRQESGDQDRLMMLAVIMEPIKQRENQNTKIMIVNVYNDDQSTRPLMELDQDIDLTAIQEGVKIITISPFATSPGFYIGGTNGCFMIFQRKQETQGEYVFSMSKSLCTHKNETISCIRESDDKVLLHSNEMRLYTYCANEDSDNLSLIEFGHGGGILDADSSAEKPLIASCGKKDRSIKIW